MKLPEFSVRRPIFTTMVCLIIVILGAVSLSRVRIDLLPDVELPTLTIRTEYEGASPEVIERLVTAPIEEIVATVPGVEEITSISAQGNSSVRVRFVWGTDIDAAALDVQATLEDEINELPEDIVRPRVSKFDIASFPVVILGVASKLDPVELTELMDRQVRYRFARIPGVAQVDLFGGYNREVRVELDPARIKALGLPLDEILQAIRDANLDRPAGQIEEGRHEVTLRAPAEFQDLDQIRSTVVAIRNGAPVTLGQIADVRDTYEKLTRIVRVNGELGLRLGIRKQADANTVEVASRVIEEIERVNKDFPQIEIVPVINQGNFIERSISNVANSVLYGGGLAVLVLLFFLRSVRSTIVISLSIPISIIATFALIYFGGFTLNLMTLGGLALGVGMMVDSSIVVLENIYRRRAEHNDDVLAAAVNGTSEVGPAIVASTLTTLVIFLPLVFVRGVSGILFKELAYVIVFSLVCSLFVALTIVPMLASRLMRKTTESAKQDVGGASVAASRCSNVQGSSAEPLPTNNNPGGEASVPANQPGRNWIAQLNERAEAAFDRLDRSYRDLLQRVLRHRAATIAGAVALLAFGCLLIPLIGTEFLPPSDEGEVRVTGEMEIGTRLAIVDAQTRRMEEIVYDAVPEAVSTVATAGGTGWRPDSASQGEIQLSLKPAKDRERSNTEIAEDLRQRLTGQIAGMTIRTRAPQGQFLLQRLLGGEQSLLIEIRGYELDTLELLADQVRQLVQDVPGITDVELSRKAGIPQQALAVDRDKASDLGISVRRVAEAIETAVAGRQAGEYRTLGDSYRILVKLKDVEQLPLDEILDLTLTSTDGQQVALRNLVTAEATRGPILIDRKDQQRIVTVEANVAGRDLGSVAEDVQRELQQIVRPVGYDLSIAGTYEEQQEAFGELIVSLMLALVLVYMVLACQYEALRDPIVVMVSVPLASIGVFLILFLTGTTLNVQSYIGCIMLGGIVVNNAILLVDQAGQLRKAGWTVAASVAEAGRRRLRPILMTTLTTILGLVPLALGIGEGADAQAPLARVVIGGLTASTLITLVLIPVIYSLVYRERSEAVASSTEPFAVQVK